LSRCDKGVARTSVRQLLFNDALTDIPYETCRG
jgi:hypothetical protein